MIPLPRKWSQWKGTWSSVSRDGGYSLIPWEMTNFSTRGGPWEVRNRWSVLLGDLSLEWMCTICNLFTYDCHWQIKLLTIVLIGGSLKVANGSLKSAHNNVIVWPTHHRTKNVSTLCLINMSSFHPCAESISLVPQWHCIQTSPQCFNGNRFCGQSGAFPLLKKWEQENSKQKCNWDRLPVHLLVAALLNLLTQHSKEI